MEIQRVFTDYSGERFYSVRLSEPELNFYQKEFGIISGLKKGWNKIKSGSKKFLKRKEQSVVEDGAKMGSKEVKEKIAKEAEIAEKTKQAEQQAKQAEQQEGFFGKHWKALSAGTAGLGGAYLLWGDKKPERRYNDYGYGYSKTYGRY